MNVMNATLPAFAALLLIAAAPAARAIEGEQLVVPPSMLTRAEVRAEFVRARAAGELRSDAEHSQQPFAVAAVPRLREEVRREARAVAQAPVDPLYVGG